MQNKLMLFVMILVAGFVSQSSYAADMAYEILVNGKNPAEMPIEYVTDNLTAKYNADIAEQLGIEIPDDIEAIK